MFLKQARYIFLLLICGMFLIYSCKKNEDETRPVISLSSPDNYDQFSVGDTMHVSGTVTHNSTLSSIKIVLKNNLNVAVTVPRYLHPNSSGFTIDINYIIDAPGLKTGTYVLAVTASDGKNVSNAFRNINIKGVDRHFKKTLVICRPNTLKTYIYSIDSSFNIHNILNLDYGYRASEVSSELRKLFMIKPEPSVLFAYDLDDPVEDHLIAASPPYPVFYDVLYSSPLTYISTANGQIKGLNQIGHTVFVTQPNADTIPVLIHPHYNYILSFCLRRGGPETFLRQHYAGTGGFRAGLKIDFSVVAFFSLEEDVALLFGNHTGESSISAYNLEGNYLSDKKDMPVGEIRDVVELSPGNYLVAHTAGIFLYTKTTTAITEWIPGFDVDVMACDPTRMLLYCVKGNTVSVFRIDNGEMINEISMPYPVLKLHILHNI